MSDSGENTVALVTGGHTATVTLDDRVMDALFGSRGFGGEFLGWDFDPYDPTKEQLTHKKVDWIARGATTFEEFQTSVDNVFRKLEIGTKPTVTANTANEATVTMPANNLIVFPTTQIPVVASVHRLVQANTPNLDTGRT